MSDRTSFRLPGHELNQLAERKCLLSFLAAYSRQWNPRNLEAPWYQPWALIFADLVAGHSSLSVAPQPYLWYDLRGQPHTAPGPQHHLNSHDEQHDAGDDIFDVGNTTLESIRSISVPSHRNRSRIPDFAVTRKISFPRSRNTSQLPQLSRRLTYVGFPLLAEIKNSGARCRDVNTSLRNAVMPMTLAREQVMAQAYHLFKMYPHQESVILVAITGFWWSYAVVTRADVDESDEGDEGGFNGLDDEKPDPTLPDQDGIHPDLAPTPSESFDEEFSDKDLPDEDLSEEELQEQIYGFRLNAFENTGILEAEGASFHTVLPDDRMELSKDEWSDFLLYGSAPSNQVLSLILERLHSIVHVNYDGKMG